MQYGKLKSVRCGSMETMIWAVPTMLVYGFKLLQTKNFLARLG